MAKYILIILMVLMLSSCNDDPIKDIQSQDDITRIKAASRFSKGATPKQIEQLIQLLENSLDYGIRSACADALGYAKATNAVPALIEALKVPQWRLRRSTTTALGRIADPRAIDPLIDIITEESSDANLSEGRRSAIGAFINLKSEKVVPVLIEMLEHNPGKDESEKNDYSTALLTALGEQGDKRAIPVIAKLLDDQVLGSPSAGAIGKIVGVEFFSNDPFNTLMPSPEKAQKWLSLHPEVLKEN